MAAIEIGSMDWNDKVVSSKIPVIVDFWAPWCPWCKRLMPIFEEVSGQYEGKMLFGKVDVQEHKGIALSNGIIGIPVMKLFCDGRNAGELVGYMTKEKLVSELDKMLATTSECLKQSSALSKEVVTK